MQKILLKIIISTEFSQDCFMHFPILMDEDLLFKLGRKAVVAVHPKPKVEGGKVFGGNGEELAL
jgi:hypothetical protein